MQKISAHGHDFGLVQEKRRKGRGVESVGVHALAEGKLDGAVDLGTRARGCELRLHDARHLV
jgi:hypothetical protein